MVLLEIMIALGNFTANVCAGVAGNWVTDPLFRRFPFLVGGHRRVPDIDEVIEEQDLHSEPYVETFTMVCRICSEILFERGVLDVHDFKEVHSESLDVTTKNFNGRREEVEKLILLLDRGVYVAMQAEKLRYLFLALYMGIDEYAKPVETYQFSFAYRTVEIPMIEVVGAHVAALHTLLMQLQKHLETQKIKRKGPWTVMLQLSTDEIEKGIPFFRVQSGEPTCLGDPKMIGTIVDGNVTCTLKVQTHEKKKEVAANKPEASSSTARQTYSAMIAF